MSDDMVTIPELRVPREELAAWQNMWAEYRSLIRREITSGVPAYACDARVALHLLDVGTSPPIGVGDLVESRATGGDQWLVLAVDGRYLGVVRTSDNFHHWLRSEDCSLVTEEMGG